MSISPSSEKRAVASLAFLYALRMLGLFMLLPVLMLEGATLTGATPQLLGIALGIYGLTQALLQIPAGAISDKIGRKPVIIGGLILFALGSVIAGQADTVYGVIIGRAMQGAGAIASAIMALVTDLTREENRTKAMALIGSSIGASFLLAMILGPLLASLGGIQLIFWLTGLLALFGILLVISLPKVNQPQQNRDSSPVIRDISSQLNNKALWPINTGIFLLHSLMVAMFVFIPLELVSSGLASHQHSYLYLPVLLASVVLMVPFVIWAEKKQQLKKVTIIGAVILTTSLLLMSRASSLWQWVSLLILFFWGFNLLEACLPSWLSKIVPIAKRGTAMGIYSSVQFLGAFFGGTASGWLIQNGNTSILFVGLALLMIFWLFTLINAQAPIHLANIRIEISDQMDQATLAELSALTGVSEALYVESDRAMYFKVSPESFNKKDALAVIHQRGNQNGS